MHGCNYPAGIVFALTDTIISQCCLQSGQSATSQLDSQLGTCFLTFYCYPYFFLNLNINIILTETEHKYTFTTQIKGKCQYFKMHWPWNVNKICSYQHTQCAILLLSHTYVGVLISPQSFYNILMQQVKLPLFMRTNQVKINCGFQFRFFNFFKDSLKPVTNLKNYFIVYFLTVLNKQ